MNVSTDQIVKMLKEKKRTRSFGSLLLYLKDGECVGVCEKNDYNPQAFSQYVDRLPKIIVKKGAMGTQLIKTVEQNEQIDNQVVQIEQSGDEND